MTPTVKVRIPTPLYSYTSHRSVVEASGSDLAEITRDLDRQFPGLRFRIVDEQDQIRPHIKLFINRMQAHGLSVKVVPTDEVAIIQAFSGG